MSRPVVSELHFPCERCSGTLDPFRVTEKNRKDECHPSSEDDSWPCTCSLQASETAGRRIGHSDFLQQRQSVRTAASQRELFSLRLTPNIETFSSFDRSFFLFLLSFFRSKTYLNTVKLSKMTKKQKKQYNLQNRECDCCWICLISS